MANVKTVTIPAGQVWVNVAQGYKCNADPDLAKQTVEYDGTTTATVYVKKGDYTPASPAPSFVQTVTPKSAAVGKTTFRYGFLIMLSIPSIWSRLRKPALP